MNNIIQNDYSKNKRKRIEIEHNTFVLNLSNIVNYKNTNPIELIIIDTSFKYSNILLQTIIDCGIKPNVKKIITSDSVIVKYFISMKKNFSKIFPNCKTIVINSFTNDYVMISRIIDDLKIVENVEYKLNDYVFVNNSVVKYKYFFDTFFMGSLSNIKCVKIINDIDDSKTNCCIEKNQITNIIIPDIIKKKNKLQFDYINKYNINVHHINNIRLDYIDNKRNIYILKYILNVSEIDYIKNNIFL